MCARWRTDGRNTINWACECSYLIVSDSLTAFLTLFLAIVTMVLDIKKLRDNFPALRKDDYIYGDNAGGSQCLKDVVDRLSDYLLYTNVQLGRYFC